jgi:DNA-binding MarR family transcriptional regulator
VFRALLWLSYRLDQPLGDSADHSPGAADATPSVSSPRPLLQRVAAGGVVLPAALGRCMTYLLRRVTDAAGRLANAHLASLGIDTRHYTVLLVVAAGAGSSQRTIADALGFDHATVVALVDALEQHGLVRRVRSREDRRANAVEVTPKGRRLLKRADALMEKCSKPSWATCSRTSARS